MASTENISEIEVSFTDLMRIVRRQAWLILLVSVLFTLSAEFVARKQFRHTAEARIHIQDYPVLFGVYDGHRAHAVLMAAPEFKKNLDERMQAKLTPETDGSGGNDWHVDAALSIQSGAAGLELTASANSPETALTLLDVWLEAYQATARRYHFAHIEKQLNEAIRQVRRQYIMSRALLEATDGNIETEAPAGDLRTERLCMDVVMWKDRMNFLTEVRDALISGGALAADWQDMAHAYREVLLTYVSDDLVLDHPQLKAGERSSVRRWLSYFVVSLFLTGGLVLFVESARGGGRRHPEKIIPGAFRR
jgi:hypothetical protein